MGKLFVTLFAPPKRGFRCKLFNFCSCTQDKFVMVVAPGHTHLLAILILYTLTVLWLRSKLYRDTAHVPASNFVTGDKFVASISLITRHSYTSQNLYLDGKKYAILSLHRNSFMAKVPRPCPDAASGNTTSPYCRAVNKNVNNNTTTHKIDNYG
jgi:hypothetical protein